MKKIILAIAIVLAVGLTANAQRGGRDGFFNDWEDLDNGLDRTTNVDLPALPGHHNYDYDQAAPLGSGLIVLTALGAGYAFRKREE